MYLRKNGFTKWGFIIVTDYQVCTRCVMDTTDPAISFDAQGHCNTCNTYLEQRDIIGYRTGVSDKELDAIVKQIKKANKDKDYDVILGISGGVDSAYMAYLAHQLGLRILAVHVDTGWNNEMAVKNIERMCTKLNIELHTIVIDWPTMKELQRAYMLSGVANLDVPQDHVLMTSVMKFAQQYKLGYVLNGNNLATEGASAPFSMQQSCMDFWHIRSIYRKHGRGKSLRKYPHLSIWEARWKFPIITKIDILNHIPFSKKEAMEILTREFGWEYYGGKHFESRFTKYFQSVYLPHKFGYDKRRYHLSCLVLNDEMTREEALAELSHPPYPLEQQQEDEAYILKKLDIDPVQWQRILKAPPTPNSDYFSQAKLISVAKKMLGKKNVAAIQRQKSS